MTTPHYIALAIALSMAFSAYCQDTSVPEYGKMYRLAAPSLAITPDARGAGMGDLGVATSADSHSIYHNLSKLPFNDKVWGVSANYTPWMSQVTKDMSIAYLDGFYRWGIKLPQAVSGSFRYFNIGSVKAFPAGGKDPVEIRPNEWALDAGYALKYHKYWSSGVTLRVMHADMKYSGESHTPTSTSVMVDLSTTFRIPLRINERDMNLQTGLSLRNLGSRISFDGGKSHMYLPASLNFGVGAMGKISEDLDIEIALELNRLLVPTVPSPLSEEYDEKLKELENISAAKGWVSSWNDSMGGFSDELKEFSVGIGAEATYDNFLSGRLGYRYKDASVGFGSGIYLGIGVLFRQYNLDISYYTGGGRDNPLNNTTRFSVSANF